MKYSVICTYIELETLNTGDNIANRCCSEGGEAIVKGEDPLHNEGRRHRPLASPL